MTARASDAAFLGVDASLTGRRWRERPADPASARRVAMTCAVPDIVARAVAARGVAPEDAANYLNPTLRESFPDPARFLGMEAAADILADAALSGRPTAVFADYDVDGAASAALLVRWFRALGRALSIYVPDRVKEGYGPTEAAFRRLKSDGIELVVTVDCGAAAHDALEAAHAMGLDVVVIDHHLMRGAPPPAAALVNPNQPGCASGQGGLAAAGVTFVLLAALNRAVRAKGRDVSPDILAWLDLAALGAICDVTPLTGFNRALTAQGLKVLSNWRNPGLRALRDAAGAKEEASAQQVGFMLGPRINAGGRIGRSDLGARLLATEDPAEAAGIAAELDRLNLERREVEQAVFEAACAKAAADPALVASRVLVIAGEDWHPGIIGIVAGRLRERFRKPAVVIGLDPVTGLGKGSGRSQVGFNLGRAVQGAFEAGLLISGGGHAMAAGMSLRPDQVGPFRAWLEAEAENQAGGEPEPEGLDIDAAISPAAAQPDLVRTFERLRPFGPGNPEPVFALADVRVEQAWPMRGGHVRVRLADRRGGRMTAVAWRAADGPLGPRLSAPGGWMHVAGRLKADTWQGRERAELEIEDAADPRMEAPD